MNFAKRGCADDANLCEVVSVAPEKEGMSREFINLLFERNRFNVEYCKQLEKTSATGTTGAYIYLKNDDYLADGTVRGGEIRINYCEADSILPFTVENDLVTECAFSACGKVRGKEKTTLVAEAGTMAWNDDLSMWREHGQDLKKPNTLSQLIDAFREQTVGELENLTRTTGFRNTAFSKTGIEQTFVREMDLALIKIASGVFSYDVAVNDCIKRLA